MIKFTLKCNQDHRFESWFKSSEAFEKLLKSNMVTCSVCGSGEVEKALMAPSVRDSRKRPAPQQAEATPDSPLRGSDDTAAQALAALRRHVEDNSEYVGLNFVREARDMHDGLTPERAIHGEARPEDARKLVEDGVPVAPLPFVPGRKTN